MSQPPVIDYRSPQPTKRSRWGLPRVAAVVCFGISSITLGMMPFYMKDAVAADFVIPMLTVGTVGFAIAGTCFWLWGWAERKWGRDSGNSRN